MSQRNETVYNLAQEWLEWKRTKGFTNVPPQKNILDRSESGGIQPNAELSPELAAFNIGLRALEENSPGYFIPFMVTYVGKRELAEKLHKMPVKTMCSSLGIERTAFYARAHEGANRIHAQALQLLMIYDQLQKEMKAAA